VGIKRNDGIMECCLPVQTGISGCMRRHPISSKLRFPLFPVCQQAGNIPFYID